MTQNCYNIKNEIILVGYCDECEEERAFHNLLELTRYHCPKCKSKLFIKVPSKKWFLHSPEP